MKFTREDVKGLDIDTYLDWLETLPREVIISTIKRSIAEKRLPWIQWRQHYWDIQYPYKEKKIYELYCSLSNKKIEELKKDIEYGEKLKSYIHCLLLWSGKEDALNVKSLFETDETILIKDLSNSKASGYAELAKIYATTCYETYQKEYEQKQQFNSNAKEKELKRLENIDFKYAKYIEDGEAIPSFYMQDFTKSADEIGTLLYFKQLAIDEPKNDTGNGLTCLEKLRLLKSIGVFELPFFSIDPTKEGNSEREQSRILSKVLEYNEDNIRKALKKVR